MRQKPVIGLLVVVVIATVFWMIGGAIGSSVMGAEDFGAWRERNFWAYLGVFAAVVAVVALPVLWFLGRRLDRVFKEQEESAAATRGIGRLAMKAVAGDVAATDHLFDLLENDPTPAIRYQAARGLAMVGRPAVDKELFRQVRYWHADDKLALIATLRRGNDMRMYGLMRLLAEDRSPQVARRARAALVHIMPRTARMDDYVEKIARPRDAKRAAAARKKAAARGESAESYPEVPVASGGRRQRSVAEGRSSAAAGREVADQPALATGDAGAESMSPAARAARRAPKATVGKPGRRPAGRAAKRGREAADGPPVRPLATGKIGAGDGRPVDVRRAASGVAPAGRPAGTEQRPLRERRRPVAPENTAHAGPQSRPATQSWPPDTPVRTGKPRQRAAPGGSVSRPERRPSARQADGADKDQAARADHRPASPPSDQRPQSSGG